MHIAPIHIALIQEKLPQRALLHPLSPRDLAWAMPLLVIGLTLWCQLTNLVKQGDIPPTLSLLWALIHTLSWGSAWEFIKRRSGSRPLRDCLLPLLVALLVCAVGHVLLFNLWEPQTPRAWLPMMYDRAPIAALLALAALTRQHLSITQRIREFSTVGAALPDLTSPECKTTVAGTGCSSEAEGVSLAPTVNLEVPTRQGLITLPASDLDYLKAAANYVEIFSGGRSYLLRSSLTEIAHQLEPAGFVRIHRSIVVNRACIARVQTNGKQPGVQLRCGTRLPLGRQYLDVISASD